MSSGCHTKWKFREHFPFLQFLFNLLESHQIQSGYTQWYNFPFLFRIQFHLLCLKWLVHIRLIKGYFYGSLEMLKDSFLFRIHFFFFIVHHRECSVEHKICFQFKIFKIQNSFIPSLVNSLQEFKVVLTCKIIYIRLGLHFQQRNGKIYCEGQQPSFPVWTCE